MALSNRCYDQEAPRMIEKIRKDAEQFVDSAKDQHLIMSRYL